MPAIEPSLPVTLKKSRSFSMMIIGNGPAFLQTSVMLEERDIIPVTNNDADFLTLEKLGLKPKKIDFHAFPQELLKESSCNIVLVSSTTHTSMIVRAVDPCIGKDQVLLVVRHPKMRDAIRHPYTYFIDTADQFDMKLWHRCLALERFLRMSEFFKSKLAEGQKTVRLLIVFFGPPDPDAIASSAAFAKLFSGIAQASFASTAPVRRFENRALLSYLKMKVSDISQVNLMDYQVIACFDAQPDFFKSSGYNIPFDICMDHHPESPGNPSIAFLDIRKHHGSCSTILAQYFYYSKKALPKLLATALLLGIKTDTANFTRSSFEPDVNMMVFLNKKADRLILRKLEYSTIPKRALKYFKRAYNRLIMEPGYLICHLGKVGYLDIGAIIAEQYLKFQKVYLTVISCLHRDKVIVFIRSVRQEYNAGVIASKLFEGSGVGGGHADMGRAECAVSNLPVPLKDIEKRLLDFIREMVKSSGG